MGNIFKKLYPVQSVASIMSDFGIKIKQLETVADAQAGIINDNTERIYKLRDENKAAKAEINAANIAISKLQYFV